MNKWVVTGLVVFSVLFLAVAFWVPGGQMVSKPLPAYPETVSEPGKYWINEDEFIEVAKTKDGLVYREGDEEVVSEVLGEMAIVTYSYWQGGVELQPGWAIGFEAPRTIVIEMGDGEIKRRKHGQMDFKIQIGDEVVVIGDEEDAEDVIKKLSSLEPGSFQEEFEKIKKKVVAADDVECGKLPPDPEEPQK